MPSQGGAGASTAESEKKATSPTPALAPAPRLRSCLICRSRKVRCDKQSPCSNCRRANISCVFPATDRPPRWARRLERIVNGAAANPQSSQNADPGVNQVMERLRTLEGLVKELTGQLEQARAAANSPNSASSAVTPPMQSIQDGGSEHSQHVSPTRGTGDVQKQFGRMVLQDENRSRYVSSGFWSKVIDELDGLKMDTSSLAADESDSSGDETSPGKTPSTQELERTPSERHAFLFGHNLGPAAPDMREFHPLPSQIPFILDVFAENINLVVRMVHIPTVTKIVRDLRFNDGASLTPANEALLFSIYYAAITSMEDDEVSSLFDRLRTSSDMMVEMVLISHVQVMTNFSVTKTELNLKYRLGLEHALAKADFLNVPDIVLVQAFAIFLFLGRRHDSPRFVWMMTGLVIRMAQALGLHRDGAHFKHLTPYEVEIRRRVWWGLCMLDVRASEDQGTDFTITRGSFDTKLPLNINDADIEPGSKAVPTEREGLTDMSMSLISFQICEVTQHMMAVAARDGIHGLDEQERLLDEIYRKFERGYFRYSTKPGNIVYWVGVCVARLVMAKMTLIIYLPMLFSPPSEHFSDELRNRLFVSAIEVAEYNHALNAEQRARHWRWAYQTYTHWHAIVYLLIDCSRRAWSPLVERAWVALHSVWLIPARSNIDQNLRVWVPLRTLMAKARKHRDAELERLRADPQAVEQLDMQDRKMSVPTSPGPYPAGSDVVQLFRERWHQLVATSSHPYPGQSASANSPSSASQPERGSILAQPTGHPGSDNGAFPPSYPANMTTTTTNNTAPLSAAAHPPPSHYPTIDHDNSQSTTLPSNWPSPTSTSNQNNSNNFVLPWLWSDSTNTTTTTSPPSTDSMFATNFDLNMDLDLDLDSEGGGMGGEVDWYNWVESAKGMEWDCMLDAAAAAAAAAAGQGK